VRHPAPTSEQNTETIRRRVRVALGEEPGDLLLNGGQVVNVFTQRVEPADVVIADGWIAGVGPHDWQAKRTLSMTGKVILPGLIDAHIHLESTLLLPSELAKVIVPRGTTTLIADPHEIGNVAGRAGIEMLIDLSANLPLDVLFMAPSCVPASEWESPGEVLDAQAVEDLLEHPRVLGLAEMMNFPGVIGGDPEVLRKVAAALCHGMVVDGHAPGLAGKQLVAYVAAGVRSDHESASSREALDKAAMGMLVQVREGSGARNLDELLPLIVEDRLGDWCFATDDIHVDDLMDHGHLDCLLRRAVAAGVPPARAVRHASLVPARHYGLTDRGAVAPGYRADIFVVEDATDFVPHTVIHGGEVVARGLQLDTGEDRPGTTWESAVRLGTVDEAAFEVRPAGDKCPVIGVTPDSIVTTHESSAVQVDPSTKLWTFDAERDLSLVACVERHHATGRVGVGLVRGFGLRRPGALGSSVAHDAHNLVITGTNSREMLTCARAIEKMGGGFAVVSDGKVVASLPLQVAGLISAEGYRTVRSSLDEVTQAAQSLGCPLPAPFATLSFLCLSVIPELRITDRGLFDVMRQQVIMP